MLLTKGVTHSIGEAQLMVHFAGTFPEASRKKARYSLRFLVPGVCYAVNNNLYLYALTLIAPPVWIILMSMRTVVTTLSYKVCQLYFKMVISRNKI